MEKLGNLLEKPSSAITKAGTASLGRLSRSESGKLPVLMAQMKAASPALDLPEDTATVWMHDWMRLASQYGLPLFERALSELRVKPGRRFFPEPPEIAAQLEELMQKERTEAIRANPYNPDPRCGCRGGGSGMERVIGTDGETYARRCPCWKQWKGIAQSGVDTKARAAGE